jgi:hypothetical protein
MTITYDPRGREGLGVVQPSSGIVYPLVSPSDDLRDLLADFFLSYEDPATLDGGTPYTKPFSIAWLYGVGLTVNAPDDAPTPTHAVDLIVTDAADRVVFDSTEATSFDQYVWGDVYKIFVWQDPVQVCRLVVHTAWPPTGDITPHEYELHILPTDGKLDDRTLARLPKRVRSLTVVLDTLDGVANIDIVAAENVDMVTAAPVLTDGKRRENVVTLNASPRGEYSDCGEKVTYLSRINGVGPDEVGHFLLAADGCYYFRRPMTLVSTSPRRMVPSIELNGVAGHLKFGNDCTPCCVCGDFVDAALQLNRLGVAYGVIGATVMSARELYHENRARWLESLACRIQTPIRVAMLPQGGPYIDIVGQFCNQSQNCLVDLAMVFTLTAVPSAAGVVVVCASTRIWTNDGASPYTMGGTFPEYSAFWDSVNPGSSVKVQFRLQFPDGGLSGGIPYTVTTDVTATVGGVSVSASATNTAVLSTEVITCEPAP